MQDTTAPALTPVSSQTDEATGPDGAVATFAASASDVVDGSDPVTFTEGNTVVHSGDTFGFGSHTITASATDQHGNSASETFTVTVQDTTAPALTPVSNQTDEATGPNGVVATFAASASDIVDGSDPVIFTEGNTVVHSGDTFGLGTHTITASATDQAGNTGSESFTITVRDTTRPVLGDDGNAVMAFQAVVGTSVLGNDSDVATGPVHVTGISDASHGAGSVGGSLAGQYGTLTFNLDGSYRYVADNAAVLAEGLQADDVFTYTAADQAGNSATATLDIKVTGHSGGAMEIVSYTAVDWKTGDVISGALYDNTGKYTVGSSVTVPGPDNLGGTWTYTVNNIGRADVTHQDVSYSGLAYDFDYRDADTGTVYDTFYGHTGFNLGQNDKVNFSGNNGLGSDGDLIVIGGRAFGIASGVYVVPEGAQASGPLLMKAVTFQAQESVTGDVITGVLFDNSGQYRSAAASAKAWISSAATGPIR